MSAKQISFAIEGMFCAQCAVNIERAMAQRDGIFDVHVNYATERATATYDPARVTTAEMVETVRAAGYGVPRDVETLHVNDLLYATSAGAVQSVLSRTPAVVRVAADLRSGQVRVEGIAGRVNRGTLARVLAGLALHAGATPATNARADFIARTLLIGVIATTLLWGAFNHLAVFRAAPELPSPFLLGAAAAFGSFAVGGPFYQRAVAALWHGVLDRGVWVALLGILSFLGGSAVILFPTARRGTEWWAWGGFTIATVLTAGWFMARGISLWRAAVVQQEKAMPTTAVRPDLISTSMGWRGRMLPPLAGFVAALALVGLYLGIISMAQGPSHALEQLAQDRVWVGLVTLGFGTQVGLYAYLRLVAQALKLARVTALTGAGTGTSTLGMIACCAHHVTDFAPLVAVAGASGLSGAVTFLAEWKIPLISFGLILNAVGVAFTLRTIRTSRAHLAMATAAGAHAIATARHKPAAS